MSNATKIKLCLFIGRGSLVFVGRVVVAASRPTTHIKARFGLCPPGRVLI
jgi:hypothetical protein